MTTTARGVGFIAPPLGLNLFVVAGLSGESILKIAAGVGPDAICMLAVVLLIAGLPEVST